VSGRYRLVLAKADFKFSAAHFTLFADGTAEPLHGHNYRVGVELSGAELDGEGLLLDVARVKAEVRAACARCDGRVLLPAASPRVDVRRAGADWEVACDGRSYRLPADEVRLLPVANTSIELLARLLWDELAPGLAGGRVERLAVEVEETDGQSCVYDAPLH
jgi:6-pyruvoyltetrahydropterin/6-carboxytetrahydropterin synthase